MVDAIPLAYSRQELPGAAGSVLLRSSCACTWAAWTFFPCPRGLAPGSPRDTPCGPVGEGRRRRKKKRRRKRKKEEEEGKEEKKKGKQ